MITFGECAIFRPSYLISIQKQISTLVASSPKGLYTILKNSEKVIIDGGMCIFVITSVSVRCGILAQIDHGTKWKSQKCLA